MCFLYLCFYFCFTDNCIYGNISDFAYKWYTIFVIFCLTHITGCENLYVHPCFCKYQYFVHFYDWAILHCVHVPLHLHSFVCWLTEWFHVLAIVNSAAVSPGVHLSFWITIFSGYMPWCGIAGSYGINSSVYCFFKETVYSSPSWLCLPTFPALV